LSLSRLDFIQVTPNLHQKRKKNTMMGSNLSSKLAIIILLGRREKETINIELQHSYHMFFPVKLLID